MRVVSFGTGLLILTLAVAVDAERVRPPLQGTAGQAAASALVNINTAPATALEALPGVGPATARRIIEYREKHGDFKKIEELMNVPGIGEKSFLKLKPLITVTPPKTNRGPVQHPRS